MPQARSLLDMQKKKRRKQTNKQTNKNKEKKAST